MNTHDIRQFFALILLLFVALPGPLAHAGEHRSDHDVAREALERGDVLPLRSVLDLIERQYEGQVVEIEFEHDDGRFIYEVRLLQNDGRVIKLEVDAADGRVLKIKRKKGD